MSMEKKKIAYLTAPGLTNLKKEVDRSQQQEEEDEQEKEDTWKDFCDSTSIHGLRFIGGNNPPALGYRIIWGIIWIIMFVLCVWLCTKSIEEYIRGDVSTATTFEVVPEIEFPGVTVCNENLYRKSAVAGSMAFMRTMVTLTNRTSDPNEIEEMAREHYEHCKYPDGKNGTMYSELEKGDEYWLKHGFVQGMKNIAMDSDKSIAKYWWNSTDSDPRGDFLNHALDHGICFTFNPGKKYLETVTYNDSSDGKMKVMENFGYGLDMSKYQTRKLINAGPHNGLRLLLNTAQDEYCGLGRKYHGAGYRVIVHESNQQPWFLLYPSVAFGPGFDVNVVVKPTNIIRKTHNLGRCEDFVYLYSTPNINERYYKSQCYQQCFFEMVYRKCNCFPAWAYRNQDNNGKGTPLYIDNQVVNLTNFCWGQSMICMAKLEFEFVHNNPDAPCPKCREPCFETKFEFEISSLLFPSDHLTELYAEELKIDASLLPDNYLLINFHFESMNMRKIDETQAFTLLDLFTYFGGILGLFLGMSVMSIAEVFHQMRISGQVYMKKRRQAQEMNSSLSTILSKHGSNVTKAQTGALS